MTEDLKYGGWFGILSVSRALGDGFTASRLAEKVGIVGTESSSETQIASAWLIKFEKWGYVERIGTVKSNGPRPTTSWKLTEKGRSCELKESLQSRFEQLESNFMLLLNAVRKYQDAAQDRKKAASAFKELSDVCHRVDPDQAEP